MGVRGGRARFDRCGRLGIEKERPQRGEFAYLFAYWSGIPNDGYGTLHVEPDAGMSRWAIEDGLHLLAAAGDADFTRGTHDQRKRRYFEMLRQFPDTLPAEQLEAGEMISDIVVAPESLMRGFFRRPTGPGWALLGDAAHLSIRARPRGSATPSSKRSTSPSTSPPPIRASTATRSGSTGGPPSTTTGPSPGVASPNRASRTSCSPDGRGSPTRARTCATPSAARSTP